MDLQKPTAHVIRALSVEAFADPRTVEKFLAGGAVRPVVGMRIERALKKLRLTHLRPRHREQHPGRHVVSSR